MTTYSAENPLARTGHSPKTYNLLSVGAGGRGGTASKNLDNTSPATTQNRSNLWASAKGNYLHPRQTQHKQGRLAGQTQMCLQQPLLGWSWALDSQTSKSFQQSEHTSVAWKGKEFQVMPTDLMIRSITWWRLWIWNFTKTLHGIGSPLTRKTPPKCSFQKGLRVWFKVYCLKLKVFNPENCMWKWETRSFYRLLQQSPAWCTLCLCYFCPGLTGNEWWVSLITDSNSVIAS